MTTLSQSSSNDIYLDSSGQLSLASGTEAYGFIIADAIRTLRGELQLDTERGVPYFDTVFNRFGGIDQWKMEVRRIINSYDFVISIKSFDAEVSGKNISYKIVIATDLGETTVES